MNPAEAARHAPFTEIRYAQCWEDADVLLEALRPRPGGTYLSIASAGDNALSLLASAPARVIALDLNPAQLACLELRVAAYRALAHVELLELIGSRPSSKCLDHYARCRIHLSSQARAFWDARPDSVAGGIGGAGKFERYFKIFRNTALRLVHSRRLVWQLLRGGSPERRRAFYVDHWNTWRWRLLFRLFFSRPILGRLGRDPSFFRYVQGQVAGRILERATHALTELDPADNPYLQWILTGRHPSALPFALRPEHFDAIREHLDRLEWRRQSVEEFVESEIPPKLDGCNLSDIFEYMSEDATGSLLEKLARTCVSGARLVYWNLLVPRCRPERLANRLRGQTEEAKRLWKADKAFFYSRLVIEEVT